MEVGFSYFPQREPGPILAQPSTDSIKKQIWSSNPISKSINRGSSSPSSITRSPSPPRKLSNRLQAVYHIYNIRYCRAPYALFICCGWRMTQYPNVALTFGYLKAQKVEYLNLHFEGRCSLNVSRLSGEDSLSGWRLLNNSHPFPRKMHGISETGVSRFGRNDFGTDQLAWRFEWPNEYPQDQSTYGCCILSNHAFTSGLPSQIRRLLLLIPPCSHTLDFSLQLHHLLQQHFIKHLLTVSKSPSHSLHYNPSQSHSTHSCCTLSDLLSQSPNMPQTCSNFSICQFCRILKFSR